jgi:hypothetical protein
VPDVLRYSREMAVLRRIFDLEREMQQEAA